MRLRMIVEAALGKADKQRRLTVTIVAFARRSVKTNLTAAKRAT
jgi:hypothetical protein